MGIVASVLRAFHGGVHPKEYKELSEHCPITPMPMPEKLYVPLNQHIGRPAEVRVKAGDTVFKGDLIAAQDGFVSAPVHAPTSGTVVGIQEWSVGHPSGLTAPCVVIAPDGKDEWSPTLEGLADPLLAEPQAILAKVQACGIVGMGGATFPSHIKLNPPKGKKAELLLVNGVECEPYLTCDARLMEEESRRIVEGLQIMLRALGCHQCVIGIEDNKPAAIANMRKVAAETPGISVQALPVMYPQGSEKQLIEVVTGRQVPSGGLPIDVGVIVHNVATALAVRNAVKHGRPLVERPVTVTGKGIAKPANLKVLVGTPVQNLIDHCGGLKPGVKKVLSGGPMMGVALHDLNAPVVKGTSGILCLTAEETVSQPERACIRCGNCVSVCPISLMPTEMAWLSRNDQWDKLQEYDLFDCIECGSCAYVCPSNIPLVHYFRYGKLSIQANARDKRKGDLAKQRTAAKEARVAAEQAEKERKKAEMKAKMAAKKPAAKPAEGESPAAAEAPATDDKAARAARAAKAAAAARAAKAAKAAQSEGGEAAADAPAAADDEKAARAARAAKAAAAARAAKAAREAKKAQQEAGE